MKKWLGCLLLAFGILCLWQGNKVMAKDKYDISVEVGLDGEVRSGYYTPVHVTIVNHSGNFEGSVQVVCQNNGKRRMYGKDVTLAAASGKTVQLIMPVDGSSDSVRVNLVNKKGKTVESSDVKIKIDTLMDSINIGVLTDDYTAMAYLDQTEQAGYPGVRLKLHELQGDYISDDWRALDMFDVILISDYSTDTLSEEQLRAIIDWTMQGGCLMIGTGSSANKTMSGFIKYGLECEITAVQKRNTNYGAETAAESYLQQMQSGDRAITSDSDPILVQEAFSKYYEDDFDNMKDQYGYYFWSFYSYDTQYDSPEDMFDDWNDELDTEFREFVFNEIDYYGNMDWSEIVREYGVLEEEKSGVSTESRKGGYVTDSIAEITMPQVRMSWFASCSDGSGYDLMQACQVSEGYYAVFAIDVTKEPFISYPNADLLFSLILDEIYGKKIKELIDSYTNGMNYNSIGYGYNNSYYEEQNMCEYMSTPAAPPMLLYILLIVAYFASLIIIFCVLKKRKKSMRVWILYPVAAFGFSLIIYLLSFATKLIKPILYVGYVTSRQGEEAYTQPLMTVAMPRQKEYSYHLSNQNKFTYLQEDYSFFSTGSNTVVNLNEYDIGEMDCGEYTELRLNNRAAMQSEYFYGSTSECNREPEISFTYDENDMLVITNRSDRTISNAFVVIHNYFYILGDIGSGEKAKLADVATVYTNDYSSSTLMIPMVYEDDFIRELSGVQSQLLKGIFLGTTSRKAKEMKVENALLHYAWDKAVSNNTDKAFFYGVIKPDSDKTVQDDDKYREISRELLMIPLVKSAD